MTDEERLARMEELVRNVVGTCEGCRYSRNTEYQGISQCESPLSKLAARSMPSLRTHRGAVNLEYMRSHDGLCGPNALLFERRTWHHLVPWMQPTLHRAAIVAGCWAFAIIFGLPIAIVSATK